VIAIKIQLEEIDEPEKIKALYLTVLLIITK
jgi:hypothetical protein